ncbi:MAG: hypothetical protein KDD22_08670, partial [Bdellovibrionales bacterium]|nr:hypothetical protein [Bdellovibrionales bacterium]
MGIDQVKFKFYFNHKSSEVVQKWVLTSVSTALILAPIWNQSAFGQDDGDNSSSSSTMEVPDNPTTSVATESTNENVERIEVTGSRIKRIDIEGPSPVKIIDKELLENSSYNSVSD